MTVEDKVQEYINDPNTRVWINYNDEAGVWQYSIQVDNTDFWLNSFDTEAEANEWIKKNNLIID